MFIYNNLLIITIYSDSFDLVDFAHVQSARTAIGIDSAGRLVLVEVDGKTGQRGLDLFDFADFLIQHFDLVNAINLDGGGSASVNRNNVVVNYPSDFCRQGQLKSCCIYLLIFQQRRRMEMCPSRQLNDLHRRERV